MESQPDLQVDGREFLRRVFLSQRPLYVNLLDDLGSIDFCLIDGDALLLECLSSPLSDLRHGGQLLHIIYLVEDFLCSFKRCLNSRFSVVWFDNHKCLWQDAQQHFLLLARHVLQQHLAVTLQQSVHTFVSWQDAAWRQFVIEVCLFTSSLLPAGGDPA